MSTKPERHPFVAARVVRALPGRVRIHIASWDGEATELLEAELLTIPGVHGVRASALTRNVLVRFEPTLLNLAELLANAARSGGRRR